VPGYALSGAVPSQYGYRPPGLPPTTVGPPQWQHRPPVRRPKANPWPLIILAVVLVGGVVVAGVTLSKHDDKKTDGASTKSSNGDLQAKPSVHPKRKLPLGYKEMADQADRFRIAIPQNWNAVNPTSPGAQAAFDQIFKSNPGLGISGTADMERLGMRLLVVGPINRNTLRAPTVNIIVRPAPGMSVTDIPSMIDGQRSQAEAAGITFKSSRKTKVGGEPAYAVDISLRLNTPVGKTAQLDETQYYVAGNGFVYIITIVGNPTDYTTILGTFDLT
jgi:hypothetical protein